MLAHFDVEIERTFFLEDLDVDRDPINCCLYSLLTGVVELLLPSKPANETHGINNIARINAILRILLIP